MKNSNIAIVGMDCRYPGAHDTNQYWDNIVGLRQQFRRIPDKRLNLAYYGSDDKDKVDATYCKKAAVLLNYHFDRIKYRISKGTFEQTDMTHWLALDVAAGALKDAGFEGGANLNRDRVGVIIGNSLNGEFTRANLMRLRWPYVQKTFEATLGSLAFKSEEIADILRRAEKIYKAPFPKPNADTLAGGLSNTIAGRICNYFDFNGGGYTIDGACSSSLLAVVNGCNSIANNDIDVALVGGVDLSIDPFELIGFSRNGALANTNMEVFGNRPQGFWPGEGCGIIVLMKEEEALEKGLNIYSVIKGWGISSDGKGGVTRPKPETQQLALKRAYEKAGYGIDSVHMFEAHGTGTPIGDKIELTALTNELRDKKKQEKLPSTVGSVKNLIGHTKAAAGIAGLIKASLALKNRLIPGAVRGDEIHAVLKENETLLTLADNLRLYKDKEPMRTSVSSFGFGGINVHITMEENPAANFKPKRIPAKAKAIANSPRNAEVFPLAFSSKTALLNKMKQVASISRDISYAELTDLSITLTNTLKTGRWKACFVASSPEQLCENISTLTTCIEVEDKERYTDTEKGIFFNASGKNESIAFLFPGQGSPIYPDLGLFGKLNKDLLAADELKLKVNAQGPIVDTSVVQPAIVQRNLQAIELLRNLGVEAEWGIGHSLGEITACAWANCLTASEALELAKHRGRVMAEFGAENGGLLALKAEKETVAELIAPFELSITGYNGSESFVVGGHLREIARLEQVTFELGIRCTRLRVSHAFHTPMMEKAAEEFKKVLADINFKVPTAQVMSTVNTASIREETNLNEHLYQQIEKPVRFIQAIEAIKNEVALFIETGPGQTLAKSLRHEKLDIIALDFGAPSLTGLLKVLAACFTIGKNVDFEELNFNRFYQKLEVDSWTLDVLVNPCEEMDFESSIGSLLEEETPQKAVEVQATTELPKEKNLSQQGILTYLKDLVSKKTEIPVENIFDDHRIMSQLHLNSLTITEIVSLVAKTFNKSHKVFSEASIIANADGALSELATLIFNGENGKLSQKSCGIDFESLPNWTHLFRRKSVQKNAYKIKVDKGAGKIVVKGEEQLAAALQQAFKRESLSVGSGGLFIYEMANDTADLQFEFLNFLKKTEIQQGDFLCLVSLKSEEVQVDLKPLLRSFQLEYPTVQAFSVELDQNTAQKVDIVLEEIKICTKFKEIIYDANGLRSESEFETFFPKQAVLQNAIPKGSVILATGGGKGITFESVRQLALATQAQVALLGRSTPTKDQELAANLQILDNEGINYKYYSADVCDKTKILATVKQINADLGPVNVLLHGAGINNPKRINNLTAADFNKTASVKVQGLQNVLDSLKECKQEAALTLLIGYGSIIAQSGMQGNTDYAWANDQLALKLTNYAKENAKCRCLTLEWSVWEGTGMGKNLNSIDTLKEQGVWPIPIDQGIEILEKVIADQTCEGRYVIAGRFGKIPTFIYQKQRLPMGRFITNPQYHVPKVEVACDVNINLEEDQYLKHHVFENQNVFPTVMILEGMAQVCSLLQPAEKEWKFTDLKINKSIFIPSDKANVLRFTATRTADNQFAVAVRSEDSDFEISCFEATIDFNSMSTYKITAFSAENLEALPLNVAEEFYDNLLFHSGPFRRIQAFYKIHALESLAQATSKTDDQWFDAFICEQKLLGDPGLNDAAIHCHQASRPAQQLLPTSASEVYINPNVEDGPFYIKTVELAEEGNDTTIDVVVFNEQGMVKMAWKNLVLTQVTGKICERNWVPALLVPYVEYQLLHNSDCKRDLRLSLQDCEQMVNDLLEGKTPKACEIEEFAISLRKKEALNGTENIPTLHEKNPFVLKGIPEEMVLQIQLLRA